MGNENDMDQDPVPRRSRVEVGQRRSGGTLSAALTRSPRGPRISVTVAHLTGLQVDVSPQDARDFAYGLLELIGEDLPR